MLEAQRAGGEMNTVASIVVGLIAGCVALGAMFVIVGIYDMLTFVVRKIAALLKSNHAEKP